MKILTVRKILPLLDLLAKFKRSKLLAARKANFFISARARKKIAVHAILANARKDHSSPLGRRTRQVKCNNWTQV